MNNYILINYGEFPDYITSTINSILYSEDNPNIYLCSDESIKHLELDFSKIHYVDLNSVISKRTRLVQRLGHFGNLSNTLWKTSLWRIFALNDVASHFKLKNFVHFDNDVVIFEPVESFIGEINEDKNYMTKLNNSSYVFGYMYCGDLKLYNKFCDLMYDYISSKKYLIKIFKKNSEYKYNEMNLIYKINSKTTFFEDLTTVPNKSKQYIFDPADYGFLIDGHFYDEGVSNIYKKNIVGKFIIEEKPRIFFEKSKPFIDHQNQVFKIVNLHIHSKNLDLFLLDPIPPVIK